MTPLRPLGAACLAVVLTVAGCATKPSGPVVSPTGIVYEPGTPPAETRLSQTATLYLRQDRFDRALALALEGIGADTANPVHYFLAGAAYTRLDRLEDADRMFAAAERLYPAYELDVEPEREAAWAAAFNAGLETYAAGEVDRTIAVWKQAIAISNLRPEAHRNLASVLTLEGRYEEAIEVYRDGLAGLRRVPATRVLEDSETAERTHDRDDMEGELARLLMLTEHFAEAEPLLRRQLEHDPGSVSVRGDLAAALSGLGRERDARELYAELLSEEGLQATQLFTFGVSLFRSAEYTQAAEAFERLTVMHPMSRDAWFNLANSLFAAEAWDPLTSAGRRLVHLDPLNENAHLITARALLERGDRDGARGALEAVDAVPAFLEGLQLRRSGAETSIRGALTPNAGRSGSAVRLRFTFYDDAGDPIGSREVGVTLPEAGDRTPFEVSVARRAAAYSYEVLTGA